MYGNEYVDTLNEVKALQVYIFVKMYPLYTLTECIFAHKLYHNEVDFKNSA